MSRHEQEYQGNKVHFRKIVYASVLITMVEDSYWRIKFKKGIRPKILERSNQIPDKDVT